jgi:hypothetical protein
MSITRLNINLSLLKVNKKFSVKSERGGGTIWLNTREEIHHINYQA